MLLFLAEAVESHVFLTDLFIWRTLILGLRLIFKPLAKRGSIVRLASRPRPLLCVRRADWPARAGAASAPASPFICALGRWTPHLISNQGDFSIFLLSTVRLQIWDFFITYFFKKLHLGSFFCARLFHPFPSLLRCCFLISSTKIFLSGVYLIGSVLSSSPPPLPPPSGVCAAAAAAAAAAATAAHPVVTPTRGSLFPPWIC